MTVRGFEADATALVTRPLSMRGSVACADRTFNAYPVAPCPTERIHNAAAFCDLSGQQLSSLSRWSYTFDAD